MIQGFTLKLKITFLFIFLMLIVGVGGYFYLTKMSVVSGNLNINKTNPIDKLCNYNISSDFYYRVENYNRNTSYAELTPVSTTICYNFKLNKVELQNRLNIESNIILDDTNGNEIGKTISLLEHFRESYSEIVATQDKDYFQKSYTTAKNTLMSLYGSEEMKIKEINPLKEYYTKIYNLPIDNMVVEHFNLKKITVKPTQVSKNEKWKANILEWNFGEKDRIYLQYLEKYSSHDLDEFVKNKYLTSDKLIIKLTKFNRNTLNKMFLIFNEKEKNIKTLFMDNNGYIYTLVMKVSNQQAFNTYFNDYMRIAYGIYFIEKNGLDTTFVKQQREVIDNYNRYYENTKKLLSKYTILKEMKCENILEKYDETKILSKNLKGLEEQLKTMQNLKFDKRYQKFNKIYGDNPNKEICQAVEKDIKNIELIVEAIKEFKPITSVFSDKYQKGAEILEEKCSKSIECIKELKIKNWKEDE